MWINTDMRELLILPKNAKPSHFHEVVELGNICFVLERKSFSDKVLKFLMIYCLTRKLKILVLSHSTLTSCIKIV